MNKVSWRKSASKDVRPFFGAAILEDSLDSAEIRIFEDAEFSSETLYQVEPTDAEKLALTVRPNFNAAVLANGPLKINDLVIALTVQQPFLKKTLTVVRLPLLKKMPEEIPIGDELLSQLGGGGNIIVELALCLAKTLPKKPGTPFLLGHWISKKSFSLRAPKLAEDFNIVPMDDENWQQMGWPAKTMYSVEYLSGFNEPAAKDRQLATVRVHADVHKKLTVESNQRLAKPIMAAMAAEISAQLIASSFSDWEASDEVVPLSPLSAFLKRINRIQPISFDELKKLAKEPGMPKLKALLQADQQSVRFVAEG